MFLSIVALSLELIFSVMVLVPPVKNSLYFLLLHALFVVCCFVLFFVFSEIKFFRVSNNLDPDPARRFVGPDLGPNCLLKLSTDGTSKLIRHKVCYSLQRLLCKFCNETSNYSEHMLTQCSYAIFTLIPPLPTLARDISWCATSTLM